MNKNSSVVYLENWLSQHRLCDLEALDIRVRDDARYPELYCLKYGVLADKSSSIVRVCRGSVIQCVENDRDNSFNFRVVAYAFDRFFNPGEPSAAELDWGTTQVYEKLDGSLIKLFNWKGEWIVSTSGTVGGNAVFGDMGLTFESLFWRAFNNCGYEKSSLDQEIIYIFELCTPDNAVVVPHHQDRLVLLAARDSKYFNEFEIENFHEQFEVAEKYSSFCDLQAVLEAAEKLSGRSSEGFVLVDGSHNRLKIKGKDYVRLHEMKANGHISFFDLWKDDNLAEFWTYFPEYEEKFKAILARIDDMAFFVEGFVNEYFYMDQKQFAEQVLYHHPKVSSAMFCIRAGKTKGFIDWLLGQNEKKFEELFPE